VLVSNRGPVSFIKADAGFDIKRGAGGLAGALDPVARGLGDQTIWVASATSESDRAALDAGAADGLHEQLGYPLYLLAFDPEMYGRYYDVVSNRMLWFANHCLWDELEIKEFGEHELDAWFDAYEPVNSRFADAILEISDEDSLVLVQDYHLTLVPGYLRRKRPHQAILHFTHSSFCGPQGLDRLPRGIPRRVIEGMLGADLVGLHVAPWVEGFLQCCEKIGAKVDRENGLVEHEGGRSWVREYPIPIDPTELHERAAGAKAGRWAKRFRKDTSGPIVARADRTEPSKNIVRGFKAFGRLLERRPDLQGNARFIGCLYPSRQSMPEYRRYTRQIEESARLVNEKFPNSIDLYMKNDYDRTIGALLVYDVLLVNPIMDGMNLVSKEGPTVNQTDGVLVLTEGAGSFEELGEEAVAVTDALDIEETALALERAIDMSSDERKRRAESLREKVRSRTPKDWIDSQLDDLAEVQRGGEPRTPPCT